MKSYHSIFIFNLLLFSTVCQAIEPGIFSHKQVLNGTVFYNQHCASCHGVDLTGGSASAVKGEDFLSRWSARSQTIGDLYFVVRTSMPLGGAGILSNKEYFDVVTYLLSHNGHPTGDKDLSYKDERIEQITVGAYAELDAEGRLAGSCPQVDFYDGANADASLGPNQQELNRAGSNDNAWLLPDHGYAGQRFSALTQITKNNVKDMQRVCVYESEDKNALQSYLFMHRGSLFFSANHSTFALDAATCKLLWRFNRKSRCAEMWGRARGVALKDGMLIRGTPDGYLIALNADTGKLIWETRISDTTEGGGGISMPPIIFENMVYVGPAPTEVGLKGWVKAFRITDGKLLWTFHAVPEPGEPGSETWGSAESLARGGGGVWTPFTLDPVTATLFIAAGNPGPAYFDEDRPGTNLYTNSAIALDARSGKMHWYKQFLPHDFHDWDLTHAGPLSDIDDLKLVIVSGKDGYVHGVDRVKNELLYSRAVSTQKDTDVLLRVDKDTHFCPGLYGGVQWNGPAYNPMNKNLYVNSVEWCAWLRKTDEIRYVYGGFYLGGIFKVDPRETYGGRLSSLDALTGKLNWRYESKAPLIAALTPTASGLVFTGELTGDFIAVDGDNGEELYRYDTGASLGAGIITYEINGRQYVAVATGPASSIWLEPPATSKIMLFALPDPP